MTFPYLPTFRKQNLVEFYETLKIEQTFAQRCNRKWGQNRNFYKFAIWINVNT